MDSCSHRLNDLFSATDGFILDIEGVLLRGSQVIPGSKQAFRSIREGDHPLVLLSNVSDLSKEALLKKLKYLGFDVEPSELICAADAIAHRLASIYKPSQHCFLLGTQSLEQDLCNQGFDVFRTFKSPIDFVILAYTEKFDYDTLTYLVDVIRDGAIPLAANLAKGKLTEAGERPGPAFFIKGLEFVTGISIEVVGKPNPVVFDLALKRLGTSREKTLMVGDRLFEDIGGAKKAGLNTCLVLSGATTGDQIQSLPSELRPDVVAKNLSNLSISL